MQIDGRRAFAAPKKKLDVSLRPKERRAEEPLGSQAKAGRVGEQAEHHFLVDLRPADDAPPPPREQNAAGPSRERRAPGERIWGGFRRPGPSTRPWPAMTNRWARER